MALSFNTVQQAYVVLHNIKTSVLPQLSIPSWPEDMARWSTDKKENPPQKVVIGWDKKSDDGWENLIFFVDQPGEEFKEAFASLNTIKGNSSICRPYQENSSLWIFGWF